MKRSRLFSLVVVVILMGSNIPSAKATTLSEEQCQDLMYSLAAGFTGIDTRRVLTSFGQVIGVSVGFSAGLIHITYPDNWGAAWFSAAGFTLTEAGNRYQISLQSEREAYRILGAKITELCTQAGHL